MYCLTIVHFSFCTNAGPLPKDHNVHEPYKPHDIKLPPPLPYMVRMIDGEGRFFLPDSFDGKWDPAVLELPNFTRDDFVHDLYKLTAMGSSGPV